MDVILNSVTVNPVSDPAVIGMRAAHASNVTF